MTFNSLIFDIKNIIRLNLINYYKLLETENKELESENKELESENEQLKHELDYKEENLEYLENLNQSLGRQMIILASLLIFNLSLDLIRK